jgi:nicotinate-nucleotide adenylyltransferase
MAQAQISSLGVLGGTFDPIHIGHLIVASEVRYRLGLDLVLFVPTGDPWQKDYFSPPEQRFTITMLGTREGRYFAVSRIEIDRQGPTYTADTMSSLKDFYGNDVKLFFIAGADAAARLGTWKGVERLAETTEVIAVTRPGSEFRDLDGGSNWPKVTVMEIPGVDVSATEIRRRVREHAPIDFLTPAPVVDYIHSNGLYLESSEDV